MSSLITELPELAFAQDSDLLEIQKIASAGSSNRITRGEYLNAVPVVIPVIFENSWVNYGGGFAEAGYYKDSNGFVHLQGMVKSGTTTTTIFTLPVGYRPANTSLQPAAILGDTISRVDVTSSGAVNGNPGHATWTSLSGIKFKAV